MADKTWIDDSTCKEVTQVKDLEEKLEKSEVTTAVDEVRDKLSGLYYDDLVIATSDFSLEKGGFTVEEVDLVDKVVSSSPT
jgi:hypothetical protein